MNFDIKKDSVFRLIAKVIFPSILLLFITLMGVSFWPEFIVCLLLFVLAGGELFLGAVRKIVKKKYLNEKVIVSIACIGVFIYGNFVEAVLLMIVFSINEYLEMFFLQKSKKSILDLISVDSEDATVKQGRRKKVNKINPESLRVGQVIVVNPGEKIPLDGKVILGKSVVNTYAITGDTTLKEVDIGDEVLSGYINNSGPLEIKVVKEYSESTINKKADMLEDAGEEVPEIERKVQNKAGFFTLGMFLITIIYIIVSAIIGEEFEIYMYNALIILAISASSSFVISMPITFLAGIGKSSKEGIVIKGADSIENIDKVDTVVFDKTGTLTGTEFTIGMIIPADGVDKDMLMEVAAYAESKSKHPIAEAIKNEFGKKMRTSDIDYFVEVPSEGIHVEFLKNTAIVGNERFMIREGIEVESQNVVGTIIYVALNGQYLGCIAITEDVKQDSMVTISDIKDTGVKKIVMLTGDHETAAKKVAQTLFLDDYESGLLGDQKIVKLEEMMLNRKRKNAKVMFVGDGINDDAMLDKADVGVILGKNIVGRAARYADAVIASENPRKIAGLIKISKKTMRIVLENIGFVVAVKFLLLLSIVLGFMPYILVAVVIDAIAMFLTFLNSMRILLKNRRK